MNPEDNQEQCENILHKLQQDINNLIKKVENKLQAPELDLRDEETQEELAKQIALLQRFGEYISTIQKSRRRKSMADCVTLQSKLNSANLALSFLLTRRREKIVFPKNTRYSIEYFLNSKMSFGRGIIYTLFRRSVRELPAPTKVLLGLALALPIYMIAIPISLSCVAFLASDLNTPSTSPIPTSNSSSNSSTSKEDTQPIC